MSETPKTKRRTGYTRTARKVKTDTSGGVRSGSTRVRVFKALSRVSYPEGLSVQEVRAKCDLPPKSGHVLSIVVEEVARGRFAKWAEGRGEGNVMTNVYCLTPLGLADLRAGKVDFTRYAGRRIGKKVGQGAS